MEVDSESQTQTDEVAAKCTDEEEEEPMKSVKGLYFLRPESYSRSDEGLRLEHVPEYCAIIGSGIIGLEFADVYTALGSECTVIEALPKLMPAFDREIAKTAERLLLTNRGVDYRTNVFASKVTPGKIGEKPVIIEMIDATTASEPIGRPRRASRGGSG